MNSLTIDLLNRFRHVSGDYEILTRQLSSGQRIVRTGIDPSGLAISKGMQTQIRGAFIATHNAQETVQLLRLADATLDDVTSMVIQIRDLSLRMANQATSNTTASANPADIIPSDQRKLYDEMGSLAEEIRRRLGGLSLPTPPFIITESATKFNTKDIFFAAYDTGQSAQVGPGGSTEYNFAIVIPSMTDIGDSIPVPAVPFPGNFSSKDFMDFGLIQVTEMDVDLEKINTVRATLGAQTRALENIVNDLNTQSIHLAGAEAQISGVNMADAASQLKLNMIQQSTMNKALMQMNDMQSLKIQLLAVLPIFMQEEE